MPVRPRFRKQLLLKLGVFLLLGVVVNVAVAWGFAVGIDIQLSPATRQLKGAAPDRLFIVNFDKVCVAQVWRLIHASNESGSAYGVPEHALGIPTWFPDCPVPAEFRDGDIFNVQWWVQAYGWPCQSLFWLRHWDSRSRQESVRLGFHIAESPFQRAGGTTWPRVLPLQPIWAGFAINTIFYAALLWVLFYGPGKIRRLVRIRRGCCPACGYKIAPGVGNECSECGHELRKVETSKVES